MTNAGRRVLASWATSREPDEAELRAGRHFIRRAVESIGVHAVVEMRPEFSDIVAVARVAVVARFLGTVITAPSPTRLVRPAPLAVAAALASQARPGRVAVRNARAATATRGSRLRTPLRGDEGYRDESADLSIHQSGEILSNTLVIQGKLANEL